jgi:hypothetical protein
VLEHAEEQKAKQDAQYHRNLAKVAVDRYEDAVDRLKTLASQPEQASLRESPEYRELLKLYEDSKATVVD